VQISSPKGAPLPTIAREIVRRLALRGAFACALLSSATSQLHAQQSEIDPSLNETVLMVPKKGLFTIELETTIYKPDGDGPFPIAIINHGKAPGDTRFQSRYRPAVAARFFLQRGYAVVVPMRQGFSKSQGSYIGVGCNIGSNGETQAEDVKATLDYVTAQGWADKNQILVIGQSHGGWTTLAFGTFNYPGVRALINFAGGLRQESCSAWELGLAKAAASYAKNTRVPSLWLYGDNDSYFKTSTYRGMFDRYTEAGGSARLVAFGIFGADSHSLFGARTGARIWQPEVTAFLRSVGMPSDRLEIYAKYGSANLTETPPSTDFAPLNDEAAIPFLKDSGRNGYKTYLTKLIPRAFAISPNGAWGWAEGGEDPLKRAMVTCNKFGKGLCRLYSVDDFVVWHSESQ
jgi:dienelactone hydrolase